MVTGLKTNKWGNLNNVRREASRHFRNKQREYLKENVMSLKHTVRTRTSVICIASRALLSTCFHAGFFLRLFFDPEDGGDMFLRNVG
jgi:hypothetical protein